MTLTEVRRFDAEWEKEASLQVRDGEPQGIETYDAHGRIHDGGDALDQLYQAWKADTEAGLHTVMLATDHDTVRDLNHRAHHDRQANTPGSWDHVLTAAGDAISVGDTVITRRNNRTLTTGSSWVKNGDSWTVTGIASNGDVTVQRAGGSNTITLPAGYATEHLDLGYAITAHQAQGRTLDTAHAAIADTTTREQLYVMTTRARTANHLYLDAADEADRLAGENQQQPRDTLLKALARTGRTQSATEALDSSRVLATPDRSTLWRPPSAGPTRIRADPRTMDAGLNR